MPRETNIPFGRGILQGEDRQVVGNELQSLRAASSLVPNSDAYNTATNGLLGTDDLVATTLVAAQLTVVPLKTPMMPLIFQKARIRVAAGSAGSTLKAGLFTLSSDSKRFIAFPGSVLNFSSASSGAIELTCSTEVYIPARVPLFCAWLASSAVPTFTANSITNTGRIFYMYYLTGQTVIPSELYLSQMTKDLTTAVVVPAVVYGSFAQLVVI